MANLTANTVPRATGAAQIDDGSITDDGTTITLTKETVVGTPTGGGAGVGIINAEGLRIDDVPVIPGGTDTATAVAGAATINETAGVVTSEALVAQTAYTLTLTNSRIAATSTVIITVWLDDAAIAATVRTITLGAGSATIVVGFASHTGVVKIAFAVFN